MRIQNLKESQKKKLGDLKIDGKIVAPNGVRREKWEGNLRCRNRQLTSLEGAPNHVGGDLVCSGNQLGSLKGAPEYVGDDFMCHNNQLTSLEGIHEQMLEIKGFAKFLNNPIKSHVLGLLLIKGLKSVEFDDQQLADIINKYLPLGDVMECQNELIDAGLEEFAQI